MDPTRGIVLNRRGLPYNLVSMSRRIESRQRANAVGIG
jgi:hypothetical protein